MKILIASDTYFPNVNGAAYFTYRLANSLAKRGHQVSVICPSRSFKDTISIDDDITVYGIRSILVSKSQNFRVSPVSSRAIQKAIKEVSPDITHIQSHFLISNETAKASKKLGIPVVGTNHFMPENLIHYLHMPKIVEDWLKKIGWRQCISIYKKLDRVTTPTQTAANLLKKAGFDKEVIAISCGIDLARFNTANDGKYLKEKYSIPQNKPVILYVGRLDKEKRIEVIIKAMPTILNMIDCHLVLAGKGKEKRRLETLADKLRIKKSITFTGFVPDADLQNIYKIANLFVIAGIAELQSIVTMEAMASGLPVVAVNAMALPELVHDQENGYLFPEDNSQVLAEKASAVLSNKELNAKMSQASLRIIQAHEINKIMNQYESLYHEVING